MISGIEKRLPETTYQVAGAVAEEDPSSHRRARLFARAAWLLVILGIVLRLGRYMANRSLWLDESMLALNIAGRSFAGLLQPLDYEQGAPIGFLMLEKLALSLFGPSEYALRLMPLVAGICAVPLFYRLSKQYLHDEAGLVAMGLFAASEPLIYYASEVKQYSIDVVTALAILLMTTQSLQRGLDARRYLGFALIGVIAIWFSHPAIFVLAGAALTLAARAASEGRRSAVYKALSLAAIWGASFGTSYALFGRILARNAHMLNYWAEEFAPLPTSAARVMWYVKAAFRSLKDVFGSPAAMPDLGHVLSGLAFAACLAGIGNLFETRRWALAALLMPIAFTLLASSMGLYPIAGRLVLFLIPVFILLVAAGTQQVSLSGTGLARIGRWTAALLVLAPLASATMALVKPPGKQETRAVLRYVGERALGGDLVYVYPGYLPPLDYYMQFSNIVGLPQLRFVRGDPEQWPSYSADLERLRSQSRVWIFFSEAYPGRGDEQGVLLTLLDQIGRRLDEFRATGASAYLYDLSTSRSP